MIIITVTSTGFEQSLKLIDEAEPNASKVLVRTVRRRFREAVNYARERHLTGGTTSKRLAVRSGRLRNAFWYTVKGQDRLQEAHLGFIQGPRTGTADKPSPLQYARTHEYGTEIRPRRAKFLAIPSKEALTPAGVPRGKPRDFKNTWIAPGTRVPFVIMQKKGAGRSAKAVVLFYLVKKSKIPARPTLKPTWRRFGPMIITDLNRDIPKAIKGGSTLG